MNYKNYDSQEEKTYNYDETKAVFDSRDLDNMLEEKKKEYLREVNLKHQERMKKIQNTRRKALAFAVAIMLGTGVVAGIHVDKVMKTQLPGDHSLLPRPAQEEIVTTYDDFIDYCNYIEETTGIFFPKTQENYKSVVNSGELENFVKENLKNGGKSL